MNMQVKEKWNFTIGAQFQINMRWMLRTDGGIIDDPRFAMVSLN